MAERPARPVLNQFRTNIRESVDSVLLSLVDAMESDNRKSWDAVKRLTGDRGEMMRKVRTHYMEAEPPLQNHDMVDALLITNAVEEALFVLSKVEQEFNAYSEPDVHVPLVRPARRARHGEDAGSATMTLLADRPESTRDRLR